MFSPSQPSIGTNYMIISAHWVLLDDFVNNNNNKIHFSYPQGNLAYSDI